MKTLRTAKRSYRPTFVLLAAGLLLALHEQTTVAAAQASEAYFVMEVEPRQDNFIIKLTEPAKIQHARDILSGKEKERTRIKGQIIKQGVHWNPPWSFHYDPTSIEFFALSVEVCDASIAYVESFLGTAGGAFLPNRIWCPWGSRLVREIPPPPVNNGLTNVSAASYRKVGFTPASIVAAYGNGLAQATEAATTRPLPVVLGGTTVRVKDSAGIEHFAPLFYVSPKQVNYQIPPGTAPGYATVIVTNANGVRFTEWTQVLYLAPGLFTASSNGLGPPAGFAVRVKVDGTQQFEPIARYDEVNEDFVPVEIDLGPEGEQAFLVLFGTGWRRPGVTAPTVTIGGVAAEITYVGEHPVFVGLDQLNVLLPRELRGHDLASVMLLVDDKCANRTLIKFK